MEFRAKLKYVRMGPRKIRRVAELVKGMPVEEAMETLYFIPKAAARPLMQTIKSATSNALNAEDSGKMRTEDLFIKEIRIDGGPIWKRIRPAPMGRAYRIRKRTSHLSVRLGVDPKRVKAIQKEKAKAKAKSSKG